MDISSNILSSDPEVVINNMNNINIRPKCKSYNLKSMPEESEDTGRETEDSRDLQLNTSNYIVSKYCTSACINKGHSDKCWIPNNNDLRNPDNQIRNFKRQLKVRSSFNGFSASPQGRRNLQQSSNRDYAHKLNLNSVALPNTSNNNLNLSVQSHSYGYQQGSLQRLRPARKSGIITNL